MGDNGKVSFGKEKLIENYNTVLEAIVKAKPAAAKGQNINADTLETIGGENATITITQSGTYYIQIYSTSNILLYSKYVINKKMNF